MEEDVSELLNLIVNLEMISIRAHEKFRVHSFLEIIKKK